MYGGLRDLLWCATKQSQGLVSGKIKRFVDRDLNVVTNFLRVGTLKESFN